MAGRETSRPSSYPGVSARSTSGRRRVDVGSTPGRRRAAAAPALCSACAPLWANTGGSPVEVSGVPARVGDVPTNTETQMNGGGSAYGLDDHIYQRLLRERIIFLGSEVRDQ